MTARFQAVRGTNERCQYIPLYLIVHYDISVILVAGAIIAYATIPIYRTCSYQYTGRDCIIGSYLINL